MAHFGEWSGDWVDHERAPLDAANQASSLVQRETEQSHLVIGGEGIERDDERRFALEVMNHILGGGMSSRLFQTIREERGLAYSVYSFAMPAADVGGWGVYAGTNPENTGVVLELICR